MHESNGLATCELIPTIHAPSALDESFWDLLSKVLVDSVILMSFDWSRRKDLRYVSTASEWDDNERVVCDQVLYKITVIAVYPSPI